MAPHGGVECEGRVEEYSIPGSVVIGSLAAFEAESERPESPLEGLNAHATIMTSSGEAEEKIKRAVSLATQGDDQKPFTVTVIPDGLGATWVDGVKDDVYIETIPKSKTLEIHSALI